MYNFYTSSAYWPKRRVLNILLMMKLTTFLLFAIIMQLSAAGFAQRLTLHQDKVSIKQVFKEIKKQTGYDVFYLPDILNDGRTINADFYDTPLTEVVAYCIAGLDLTYSVNEKTFVIKKKPSTAFEKIPEVANKLQLTVMGKVVNENGEPLAGAVITIKGTNRTVTADNQGVFVIKDVEGQPTLVISFVGYQPLELPAKASMGTITMVASNSKLDEIQIIAYSTTTQRFNTGSVGSVKAEIIEKQPVGNVLNALVARIPGLDITQQSGVPGSGVTVRVRGTNSLTATANDPLFLIDGVPFLTNSTATTSQSSYRPPMGGNSSPFNSLNPADIESVEVLKDADATAIYGSRGANGVILITTKRSRTGQTKFDVNHASGFGQVARIMEVLNRREYLDMRYEALRNDGVDLATATANVYDLKEWDTTRTTNWQELLIGNTANYTNTQLNISGGNNNTSFSLGGAYWKETTVFPGDFADIKGSARFSISHNSANNRLKVQLTGTFLNEKNTLPAATSGDLVNAATTLPPIAPPVYQPDGQLNFAGTTFANPFATLRRTNESRANNLNAKSLLSYRIINGLEIKANLGYSNFRFRTTYQNPSSAQNPVYFMGPANRQAEFGDHITESWNVEPQINYDTRLAGNALNVLLGSTFQQTTQSGVLDFASGFVDDALLRNKSLATSLSSNFSFSDYKYNAIFLRANYNIRDKYLFNLTGRRDGSSRFGPGRKFGNFGAVGAAWVFSEEKLIKETLPFLTFGKLRASYGITGSDAVANYGYLSLYNSAGTYYQYYGDGAGIQPANLVNNDFGWESNKKADIALELGFLNERILLSANYYHNRSSNQLVGYPVSGVSGFTSIPLNLPATVQNSGWELELNTVNVRKKVFSWSSSVNLTVPKNKLIDYPLLSASSFANTYVIGKSINIVKVVPTLGVDPETGVMVYQNRFGQPVTNIATLATADRTVAIDIGKQFYGGLSNVLNYKQFQLDVFFQFSKFNGLTYNVNGIYVPGYVGANLPKFVYEGRWQYPGQDAEFNKLTQSTTSAAYVGRARSTDDAAYDQIFYARLKNLSLSYTFNQDWLTRIKVQNLRVYALGQNLVTITNYKGMDPENQSASIAPIAVITFGAQVTF